MLLEKIVARCCGNCTGGDGESEISYVKRRDNLVTKARDFVIAYGSEMIVEKSLPK